MISLPVPPIYEKLYKEHEVISSHRDKIFKPPTAREEEELKDKCTFQPDLNISRRGMDKENALSRRSPDEFLRDMRAREEVRRLKLEMMQEQRVKEE